jgi:uncharacterized membrane protein
LLANRSRTIRGDATNGEYPPRWKRPGGPDVLRRLWRALLFDGTRADRLALGIVLALTVADAIFFSTLAVQRYLGLHADAFDLGIEDQATWSTLHGQLFGITLERRLTTSYLGYHFEPISLVGPFLYLIYPSPISLIVFKCVVVALGTIAAYWLARRHLRSPLLGVIFALAYALFPGLEAADLYDFHAYTLTAPFLLIAFCFLEARCYGWLLLFLGMSAATKENAPLDAVPLGLYLAVVHRRRLLGLGAALAGLAWFGIATYLIIPRFNTEGQSWLWTRYGGMGGSPLGALQHFVGHPELLLAPVPSDPNWHYLALLTAPVAGLTLLSPTALFLMGPALAVNLLTDYEPMHFLETYHYSAHLVPYVLLGAVYAAGTLSRLAKRARVPVRSLQTALAVAVLAGTLAYHHYRGYTPLSGQFVGYTVTAHDRLGDALAGQLDNSLPPSVVVSAQGNLYPHVDHRPTIFMFPEVDTADVIVLDVATLPNTTGINEGIHARVRQVLDSGAFGVVEADDGFLVLRRGAPRLPLPDAFFRFARASAAGIEHPLRARFGDALELLGFDVLPDRDGKVNLRAYWQADRPIAQDLFLPFFITDGRGHEVGATLQRQPANVWYPTNRWQTGEVVAITTYNLPIGRRGQNFGIALGAQPGNDPWSTGGRLWPVLLDAPTPLRTPAQGALLEVLAFHDDHDLLTPVAAPLVPAERPARSLDVAFDEGVGLAGYTVAAEEGKALRLTLFWTAHGATRIPYTVFAHVLDRDGKIVAQRDSPPDGGLKATTAWLNGETIVDHVDIPVPAGLDMGSLRLEVGLYDPVSGRRLPAHVGGQTTDHVDLEGGRP